MIAHLTLAYVFIYICLGLIGIGIILLFQMKLAHNRELRNIDRYEKKHRDYFVYIQSHLEEDAVLQLPLGKLTKLERRMIQLKYIEWIEAFKGDHRRKLIQLCHDSGFVQEDLKLLRRASYGKRVEVAYRLGGMRAGEAVPELLHLMQRRKYNPLMIVIARAIAKSSQQPKDVLHMLRSLLSHNKPIHALAADIVTESSLDSGILYPMLLEDADPGIVQVGMAVTRGRTVPEVMPALKRLTGTKKQSLREEAVQLYLGTYPALHQDAAIRLMKDSSWEVRAATVRSLGMLGVEDSIDLLTEALRDSSSKVRYLSAESLSAIGESGFEALCRVARNGKGLQRDAALERIEIVLAQETEHSALEHMVAYNKKRLLHTRYFGNKSTQRIVGKKALGGDYTA
ncbi:HEAT repeat domain-containing protein [Paenibacillus pini]|uniref:HEAT:PBS lyase HEAT-like repeat n=1 Tax=Paenibacillus pini JCM 16418 TaxID=1236976 RepID=W7Y8H5_9BACL|nr:HEAT repeat domain-containing protein [Paenibacillus pini]GAF07210.1 HEAT:PBS lyase HEAT-like repeat [Paenibacillus pini JCM 16418]